MSRRARTRRAHARSFERAPRAAAGEVVRWVRDDDAHPGWFVGVDAGGVEGYFPARWFEVDRRGGAARALRGYDAAELTVAAGVEVELLATEAGWALVRTEDGEEGWVPAACLGERGER